MMDCEPKVEKEGAGFFKQWEFSSFDIFIVPSQAHFSLRNETTVLRRPERKEGWVGLRHHGHRNGVPGHQPRIFEFNRAFHLRFPASIMRA